MCNRKPGNRCSAHASARWQELASIPSQILSEEAVASPDDLSADVRKKYDDAQADVRSAYLDYLTTKEGQQSLSKSIEASAKDGNVDKVKRLQSLQESAKSLHERRAAALKRFNDVQEAAENEADHAKLTSISPSATFSEIETALTQARSDKAFSSKKRQELTDKLYEYASNGDFNSEVTTLKELRGTLVSYSVACDKVTAAQKALDAKRRAEADAAARTAYAPSSYSCGGSRGGC